MLKGSVGDGLNLLGSALGFNVKKLLRWLALGIYSRALWVCRVVDRILLTGLHRTTPMGTLDSIH
jgi:hypothetical protein